MRLRGSRRIREVAALGYTSARLSCRTCKTVSTIPLATLGMPADATLDDLSRLNVPCSACGSSATAFAPHDLGVVFESPTA